MKRGICILLALALLSLTGCANDTGRFQEPVSFYYVREEFTYGTADGVIAGEIREAAGLSGDRRQLLNRYLEGPDSAELISPFPAGVRVVELKAEESRLTVVVSDAFAQLTGLDLTVACACLTKTAIGITGCTVVTIQAETAMLDGSKSVTMDEASLFLLDTSSQV